MRFQRRKKPEWPKDVCIGIAGICAVIGGMRHICNNGVKHGSLLVLFGIGMLYLLYYRRRIRHRVRQMEELARNSGKRPEEKTDNS